MPRAQRPTQAKPAPKPGWPVRRRTNTPVKIGGVRCLRESTSAIYVLIPAVPGRRAGWRGWIPQSQVHDDSEVWRTGDRGQLVLTRWIAEQKGLVR